MSKKPFRETKVGKFLTNAAPEVLDVVGDITGIDAISRIGDAIGGSRMDPEQQIEAERLLREFALEEFKLEIDLLKSAHEREKAIVVATGKPDYMQWFVGAVGLGLMVFVMVYGVLFEIRDKAIYHHILGLSEGVSLGIYGYYFGSSIGSKVKTKYMQSQNK